MKQLVCEKVSLGYDGKSILDNLSFEIDYGEYLCIVGENGSGKSTLIKSLLRLKEPLKGNFLWADGIKNNQIGYLPQQTNIQKDFPASVNEIVLSGCLNHKGFKLIYSKEDKKIAEINMKKLDIFDLKDRCYRELSGGQQQRVLLARALCSAKKMLLLDEPVTGLDPKITGELYELIYKLNQDEKMTIIMVSHDISSAIKYATHILHIEKNNVFFGTKQKYEQLNYFLNSAKGGKPIE